MSTTALAESDCEGGWRNQNASGQSIAVRRIRRGESIAHVSATLHLFNGLGGAGGIALSSSRKIPRSDSTSAAWPITQHRFSGGGTGDRAKRHSTELSWLVETRARCQRRPEVEGADRLTFACSGDVSLLRAASGVVRGRTGSARPFPRSGRGPADGRVRPVPRRPASNSSRAAGVVRGGTNRADKVGRREVRDRATTVEARATRCRQFLCKWHATASSRLLTAINIVFSATVRRTSSSSGRVGRAAEWLQSIAATVRDGDAGTGD